MFLNPTDILSELKVHPGLLIQYAFADSFAIEEIVTDSRGAHSKTIFIAYRGENLDGPGVERVVHKSADCFCAASEAGGLGSEAILEEGEFVQAIAIGGFEEFLIVAFGAEDGDFHEGKTGYRRRSYAFPAQPERRRNGGPPWKAAGGHRGTDRSATDHMDRTAQRSLRDAGVLVGIRR